MGKATEALRYLKDSYEAPCKSRDCYSVFCYLARVLTRVRAIIGRDIVLPRAPAGLDARAYALGYEHGVAAVNSSLTQALEEPFSDPSTTKSTTPAVSGERSQEAPHA